MIGWIKVYRKIQDHWLYENKRPKTKLEAWIHILLTVNFKESKMLTRGVIYDCKRGQSLFSLQTWAKEFNWSMQSVRTFFNQLEKDEMIHTEGLQYTTRLTVCNYESYQDESTDEQQTNNTPLTDGQQTANKPLTTIEERKKEKNKKSILFSECELFDFEVFKKSMSEYSKSKYHDADMNYYYETVKNWSLSNNNRKIDWLATTAGFMLRDISANKYKKIK